MNVTCDKCRKKYEISIKEQVKYIDGMKIERMFFVCPYCKKVYTICYKNSKMNVLNKQIKRLVDSTKGREEKISFDEAEKIAHKIRFKQEEVKRIGAILFLRYHKEFEKED